MRLLGYLGWLLRCYYAVAMVLLVVDMRLLRYSVWLLVCCYVVARVLWVVARLLLCGCYGT